jgi:hypothetical protein
MYVLGLNPERGCWGQQAGPSKYSAVANSPPIPLTTKAPRFKDLEHGAADCRAQPASNLHGHCKLWRYTRLHNSGKNEDDSLLTFP